MSLLAPPTIQAYGHSFTAVSETMLQYLFELSAILFSLCIHIVPVSASMEKCQVVVALFFTLVLATVNLSTSHVLKGSVICLDCKPHSDLSGIQVLVKCDKMKKLAIATTQQDGTFDTELPSDGLTSPNSLNCLAKILGGPRQLYTLRKDSVSTIVKPNVVKFYATSKPLNFYTSCPLSRNYDGKCVTKNMEFGSSKTVDLPVPREWGIAPTSYYAPFIPIIGIP